MVANKINDDVLIVLKILALSGMQKKGSKMLPLLNNGTSYTLKLLVKKGMPLSLKLFSAIAIHGFEGKKKKKIKNKIKKRIK